MKYRIASLTLAILLIALAATQVFAYEGAEEPELEQEELEIETVVEEEEPEPEALFYLDGEPLYDIEAEKIGNTYYVTLRSVLSLLDPAAVLEEEEGIAAVTSEVLVVVEPEADSEEQSEETEETEAVVEVLDTLTMTAAEGERYVVANGRYLYVKDGVTVLDGAVAVPVRILTKVFGVGVWYDSENEQVFLTSAQEAGYLADGEDYYDEEDLYWLTRVIYCESGNQPLEGKVAVGNVVMNRVANPRFPDTIYDVLFQKNQFYNNESKLRSRTPNEESAIAAMIAMDGGEALDGVLFFNRVGLKCYASKNCTYVATIGGHAFYS